LEGGGVDPDRDQAMQWFQKAAAHGSPNAKTLVAALQAEKPPQSDRQTNRDFARAGSASDAPLEPIAATHTLPPYPTLSQRLGEGGISVLQVHIQTDGSADKCTVTDSSGSTVLDRRACEHVKSHWRWKPPVAQGKPQAAETRVEVHWSLNNSQEP